MDDKSKEILKDYELSLEDLTFNSKPIINMLTMLADKHRALATQIIELIETRFFKVRSEHRLPTLYLLDSIIKNLGGEYLQMISKNIVRIFCEAFQSLTDPKVRIALYKLRQTWSSYIAVKKLAAIDQHIHALDQNWPITAHDDPLSPTIFVNPKFLGSNDSASATTTPSSSVHVNKSTNQVVKTKTPPPRTVTTPPPKTTPTPTTPDNVPSKSTIRKRRSPMPKSSKSPENGKFNALQDKRKRLQESLKQKKLDKKRAMGLIPSKEAEPKQEEKPHPSSIEFMRSLDPIPKKPKKRSLTPDLPNPHSQSDTTINKANEHTIANESPSKKPRLEEEFKPINQTLLDLDDLPSELFDDHQGYILTQAKRKLKSGKLSASEHNALVEQVEQLYSLQKLKNEQKDNIEIDGHSSSHSPPDQTRPLPKPHPPQSHSPPPPKSQSHTSPLPQFVDRPRSPLLRPHPQTRPHSPPRNRPHSPLHRPRPHSPPHFSSVPSHFDDRFPPIRGGHRYPPRGNFRPPPPRYRGMRPRHPHPWGRGYPPHEQRSYYEEYPPPRMELERYPPPQSQPILHGRPRPQREENVADIDISLLYKQLEQKGLLPSNGTPPTVSESGATPSIAPPPGPPIPDIPLTIVSVRRRYEGIVDLLLRGEPCTSCGLRFTGGEKEAYQRHLDWHYNENRIDKEGTRSISRGWNVHYEDWLTLDEVSLNSRENDTSGGLVNEVDTKEESVARDDEAAVSCRVLPGEDSEVCTLCHEPLEQFWEEDEEEWHFKEAVRGPDNQLFHCNCYVDYKETNSTPLESNDDKILTE